MWDDRVERRRRRREKGSCRRRLGEYDDGRDVEEEVEEGGLMKTVVNGMMSMMQAILYERELWRKV
jgi:hypothetical protein